MPQPECVTGKVGYATLPEAQAKGKQHNQRPYVCGWCQQFHLSKQPYQPGKPAARRRER